MYFICCTAAFTNVEVASLAVENIAPSGVLNRNMVTHSRFLPLFEILHCGFLFLRATTNPNNTLKYLAEPLRGREMLYQAVSQMKRTIHQPPRTSPPPKE